MKLKLKKIDKAQAIELVTAHVEKVVFGIFILFFLLFCFGALGQKPYDKRPDEVKSEAARVDTVVEGQVFDVKTDLPAVKQMPKVHDIPELVFVTRKAWSRPPFDIGVRRPEPKFLPLEDLRVADGYGAVAVREDAVKPVGKEKDAAARPAAAPRREPPPPKAGGGLGSLRNAAKAARPQNADDGPGMDAPQRNNLAAGGVAQGKQWAVITGLVPIRSQIKEYHNAFRDVNHKRPDRDYPRYESFEIERMEVQPGSAAVENGKWVAIDPNDSFAELANCADFAVDEIDPRFKDSVLCERLPMLVGKQHDKSVEHPKIPVGEQPREKGAVAAPVAQAAPQAPRGGLGALRGGGGGAGAVAPHNDAAVASAPKVDHLLFRFFDFSVQPGKAYRYRVRLVLENPNHDIPVQYLLNAQFSKGRTREAPWSEPSPPVTVAHGRSLLAGGVKRASGLTEQKAEVVVRMWDQKGAVDALRIAELIRGQVANFAAEKVVVDDPIGGPREVELAFQTESLLVDMAGGDMLPGVRAKGPGRLLLMDADGQLAVRSELSDAETYEPTSQRIKNLKESVAPPPPAAESADGDDKSKKKKKDGLGGLQSLRP